LFELLDDETPVLDVGLSYDGVLEISFNASIGGRVVDWKTFLDLLGEGKALAEGDQ
jgi:hypothetical protein